MDLGEVVRRFALRRRNEVPGPGDAKRPRTDPGGRPWVSLRGGPSRGDAPQPSPRRPRRPARSA